MPRGVAVACKWLVSVVTLVCALHLHCLITHTLSQPASPFPPPSPPQALVGVSFSLGFIFGPTIGALFSILGHSSFADSFDAFQFPALFAFVMAVVDIVIIAALFKETLPPEQRVRANMCTLIC